MSSRGLLQGRCLQQSTYLTVFEHSFRPCLPGRVFSTIPTQVLAATSVIRQRDKDLIKNSQQHLFDTSIHCDQSPCPNPVEFNGHFANKVSQETRIRLSLISGKTIIASGEIKSLALLFRWGKKPCIMLPLWVMPIFTTGNYLRQ